jgi:hypothetical protein
MLLLPNVLPSCDLPQSSCVLQTMLGTLDDDQDKTQLDLGLSLQYLPTPQMIFGVFDEQEGEIVWT